eukprot:SAG11_NODE_6100_length_1388_cov_1.259891_3_plen_126_part_00
MGGHIDLILPAFRAFAAQLTDIAAQANHEKEKRMELIKEETKMKLAEAEVVRKEKLALQLEKTRLENKMRTEKQARRMETKRRAREEQQGVFVAGVEEKMEVVQERLTAKEVSQPQKMAWRVCCA